MQISFVKSLTMDSWTDRQLTMMKEGGNAKFKSFMETYSLNQDPPATKYRTLAAEYYRKSLKAKVGNEAFEEPLPEVSAGKKVAPEFAQAAGPTAEPHPEEEPKKTTFQYISGGFFAAVGAVKSAGVKAKETIEESKVGQSIASAASTAGHFVVDKTKVAATAVKNQGSKIAVRPSLME
eukprot:TRINITY_DN2211_c0_g1_i2.p1 TRINITY_DN2211_c0_g1~~TRINITY_DN2211_c0_g1_i2.p1  ORF type:complete len:179 (+),score=64.34 TRINITY_DN2211_c0_g1_i2:353-889(+)